MLSGFGNSDKALENTGEAGKLVEEPLGSIVKNDFFMNFLSSCQRVRAEDDPAQRETQAQNVSSARDLFAGTSSSQQNQGVEEVSASAQDPRPGKKKSSGKQKIKIENMDEGEDGKTEKKKRKRRKKGEVASNVSELDQQHKTNSKNLYINKINNLISEGLGDPDDKLEASDDLFKNNIEMSVHPYKIGSKKSKQQDKDNEDGLGGEKSNEKQARNRESARNSRIRKKIYIDLLEKKVEKLTQELEAAKKQIEQNNLNAQNESVQSKLLNNLANAKQQLYDKLERALNNDADESEVNLLIDSLRLRLGATGSERLNMLDFFYKQIIDQLMPVHIKYMLWAAKEEKDFFFSKRDSFLGDDFEMTSRPSHIWMKIAPAIGLTENQKKSVLKYKKRLNQEKTKMDQLIQSLDQTRKEILKQSHSIQSIVDDFRNVLTPVQNGRLLVLLEQERNRKEFSASRLWHFAADKSDDEDSSEMDDFELEARAKPKNNSLPVGKSNYAYQKRPTDFELNRSPDYLDPFIDLGLFGEASGPFPRKKVHATDSD